MSESHSDGLLVKKFCTQRTDKCDPCGNKYADCVKKNPTLATSFTFPRLVQAASGPETLNISHNAHHLLCVAEVTKVISKDEKLKAVLENTVYCINASVNMMALPLFGHTVYWYCLFGGSGAKSLLGAIMSAVTAPAFKDLPNHDFDHGMYNKEVEDELKNLSGQVKQAEHSFTTGQLAGALNAMSTSFLGKLQARGVRKGGTHASWQKACEGDIDEWYLPFSLADDPAERGFPGRFDRNLERLKNAIKNLLNG